MHAHHVDVLLLYCCVVSCISTSEAIFSHCSPTLTTQAMAPASVFSLALVIYTGFTIPTKDMQPWFRWINYLNPVGYAFEAIMINEVQTSHLFFCTVFDGGPVSRLHNTLCSVCSSWWCYDDMSLNEKICATTGAAAGADFVDEDTYLAVNFNYVADHLWR